MIQASLENVVLICGLKTTLRKALLDNENGRGKMATSLNGQLFKLAALKHQRKLLQPSGKARMFFNKIIK